MYHDYDSNHRKHTTGVDHCKSGIRQKCVHAEGAQTAAPYQDQPLTSMEPNPYGSGAPGRKPTAENQAQYFKLRLLECIVGLDRGFSASPAAAAQVESATLSLTGQSSPVSLSWTSGTDHGLTAILASV